MNVGIVCYASVGGSGVVATELAKILAARGHQVHLISTDTPFRLGEFQPNLSFHQVLTPTYPLFREPQYLLSLANKIAHVARAFKLQIVHAHYAVPHATAAFLAREVLAADRGAIPKIVTTLHGTDITLVGSDPSYSEIVSFSIERSDGVTAVSESLRAATCADLRLNRDVRVIPNFLDTTIHRRLNVPSLRDQLTRGNPDTRIVIHVSNFRPVKRIDAVLTVFDRIRHRLPARLLLVGDGPEMGTAQRVAKTLDLEDVIDFVGQQEDVLPFLSVADLLLLPSAQESFGLAALEAMACEVPVVASAIGGLPEVVRDGVTGRLHPPDDLDGMAASAVAILSDRALAQTIGTAARRDVTERFDASRVVPLYEDYYASILSV